MGPAGISERRRRLMPVNVQLLLSRPEFRHEIDTLAPCRAAGAVLCHCLERAAATAWTDRAEADAHSRDYDDLHRSADPLPPRREPAGCCARRGGAWWSSWTPHASRAALRLHTRGHAQHRDGGPWDTYFPGRSGFRRGDPHLAQRPKSG